MTTSSTSLVFTCCDGERFLQLPGLGMAHIPFDWEDITNGLSIVLPGYAGGWIGVTALLMLFMKAISKRVRRKGRRKGNAAKKLEKDKSTTTNKKKNADKNSAPDTNAGVSLFFLAAAPIIAYALLVAALHGPLGRWIAQTVQSPKANNYRRYRKYKKTLLQWENNVPHSPLAYITGGKPAGNVTFFSPQQARNITDRVMAVKDTQWTYSAALARGTGLFLLGTKYGGVKKGGRYLPTEERMEDGQKLWDQFGDVYQDFAEAVERTTQHSCRLYRQSWPPTFIMHAGSVLSTHVESMDIHRDKELPEWFQEEHAGHHPDHFCNFQHQLTLLVSLQVPAAHNDQTNMNEYDTGAAFDWYDSNGTRTTIRHAPGKALWVECGRPHNLHPFRQCDVLQNSRLRIVLHALVVPCWKKNNEEQPNSQYEDFHYSMIGPFGFGTVGPAVSFV